MPQRAFLLFDKTQDLSSLHKSQVYVIFLIMQNIYGLICQPEWAPLYTICKLFIKLLQNQNV